MSAIPDTFPVPLRAPAQGRTALAFALSLGVHVAFFGLLAWSIRGEPRTVVIPVELVFGTLVRESPAPVAEPSSGSRAAASPASELAASTVVSDAATPGRPVAPTVARRAPRATKPEPAFARSAPAPVAPPARLALALPMPPVLELDRATAPRSVGEGDATLELAVRDWLKRHQRYPRAARRAGLEGTAHVRFVISRDGALREHELVASSGHAVLDRAALELLERAAPYPALPRRVTVDAVELTLPVEYRLDADATRG